VNRILAVILGAAVLALVGFGVMVFTSPPPVMSQPGVGGSLATGRNDAAPEPAAEAAVETPAATQRFEQWARPLRDAGLEVTAERVAEAGETLSATGLTFRDLSDEMGWEWSAERASLYDAELFHLQLAGAMTFAVDTEAGRTAWSGSAEGFGVAIQKDVRDALGRSLVVRIAGLSVTPEGGTAPFTLGEGQLRILLKPGTGLVPQGSELALRLGDLVLPSVMSPVLDTKIKSLATQFPIDRAITRYSVQQVIDFFKRGTGLELGTAALDWGLLHFTGKGNISLDRSGEPRGRFDANVADPLTLLDAIEASGGPLDSVIASEYAAGLLELGRQSDATALPMVISLRDGALAIEGVAGEIPLGPGAPLADN